jgi:signal transduction histidine kinase
VRTIDTGSDLEVYISDDGRGFDPEQVSPEKTSLFKAKLKAREAGGMVTLKSVPRPQPGHGTIVILRIPLSSSKNKDVAQALLEPGTPEPLV